MPTKKNLALKKNQQPSVTNNPRFQVCGKKQPSQLLPTPFRFRPIQQLLPMPLKDTRDKSAFRSIRIKAVLFFVPRQNNWRFPQFVTVLEKARMQSVDDVPLRCKDLLYKKSHHEEEC